MLFLSEPCLIGSVQHVLCLMLQHVLVVQFVKLLNQLQQPQLQYLGVDLVTMATVVANGPVASARKNHSLVSLVSNTHVCVCVLLSLYPVPFIHSILFYLFICIHVTRLSNNNSASVCAACGTKKTVGSVSTPSVSRPTPTLNNQCKHVSQPQGQSQGPKQADIDYLTDMGFPKSQALKALNAKKTRERALDYLIQITPSGASQPSSSSSNSSSSSSSNRSSNEQKQKIKPSKPSQPKPAASSGGKSKSSRSRSGSSHRELSAAEAKKLELKRKRNEEKRAAELALLQKQVEAQEQELKAKALEARKHQALEASRRKKEQDDAKRLAEVTAERARAAERKATEDAKWARKFAEEQTLVDIPSALSDLEANYGPARLAQTLNLVCKILRNILSHPAEPKFRSIKLANEKIQKALVRPLGAWVVMRRLGFELNPERTHLTMGQPDLALLQSELNRFQTASQGQATIIKGLFVAYGQDTKASELEQAYFALIELKKVLHNVLTLPEERNFRSIDLTSEQYLKRLSVLPAAMKIIHHYGWRESKGETKSARHERSSEFLVVEEPDLKALEAGLLDIQKELARLGAFSPIFKATIELFSQNPAEVVVSFLKGLLGVLTRILSDPEQEKYYKFNLVKFFRKFNKNGHVFVNGKEYIQLFGFESSSENQDLVVLPSSLKDRDLSLLQLKKDELLRGHRYVRPPSEENDWERLDE